MEKSIKMESKSGKSNAEALFVEEQSLLGAFVSVMIVGGIIIAIWLIVFFIYISRG